MKKYKVPIIVERRKRGLFGTKRVREKRNIWVDKKTLKDIRCRPYTLGEMVFYDWLF